LQVVLFPGFEVSEFKYSGNELGSGTDFILSWPKETEFIFKRIETI